ncbi:hypothetical protein ACLVWO_05950 [Streptomyces sp. CWNU-52H]|uniref:hypothetical protein n=1 Tax=Streptomyces sp. CWNU-52H TaxID=3394352 RepID=UPI0039BFA165
MTTTDPYRLDGGAEHSGNGGSGGSGAPAKPGVTRDGFVRTALWLVLVISTVSNMVASYSAAPIQIHLACGAVTALCATVLVTRHLRGRR